MFRWRSYYSTFLYLFIDYTCLFISIDVKLFGISSVNIFFTVMWFVLVDTQNLSCSGGMYSTESLFNVGFTPGADALCRTAPRKARRLPSTPLLNLCAVHMGCVALRALYRWFRLLYYWVNGSPVQCVFHFSKIITYPWQISSVRVITERNRRVTAVERCASRVNSQAAARWRLARHFSARCKPGVRLHKWLHLYLYIGLIIISTHISSGTLQLPSSAGCP